MKQVIALSAAAGLMQFLDLHSTLSASALQHESNRALAAWAVDWPRLTLIKAFDLALIAALCWIARNRPRYRKPVIAALLLVFVVYGAVVANNYLSR